MFFVSCQLADLGSKVSHGFVAHDEVVSNHILTNIQPPSATNFHSYSSPPPASVASAPNGPVTANGTVFPSNSQAAAGGGVAFYRDAVAHVQSAPGSAAGPSSIPPQPAHHVILTTSSSSHVPVTTGRTIVVAAPTSVPSHATEPTSKRVCVDSR
jgi:hypothetical protein